MGYTAKRRLELLIWGLVILLFVAKAIYIISIYSDLPPRIAIHFDLHGEPNGFGARWSLWELYAIDVFCVLVMWGSTKLPDSLMAGFNDIPAENRQLARSNIGLMMSITALITSLVLAFALWYIVTCN